MLEKSPKSCILERNFTIVKMVVLFQKHVIKLLNSKTFIIISCFLSKCPYWSHFKDCSLDQTIISHPLPRVSRHSTVLVEASILPPFSRYLAYSQYFRKAHVILQKTSTPMRPFCRTESLRLECSK